MSRNTGTETEVEEEKQIDTPSVHTEPSGTDDRDEYDPYRTRAGKLWVSAYRQWWLNNPLNNLWNPKPSLWNRFQKEMEGADPAQATVSGANLTLDDLKR